MNFHPMELGLYGVMITGALLFAMFPDPVVRRKGVAFFAAWFVPGLGHAIMTKWKKGLFLFGVLSASYMFGLWICGWRTVSFEDNPFYYVGQYGCGLTMFLGHALGIEKSYPRPDLPLTWYDPGLLYVCVAGLLNMVITLGVLEIKEKEPENKEEPKPAPDPKPEPEAAAAPDAKPEGESA